jgi:hypothetical protein
MSASSIRYRSVVRAGISVFASAVACAGETPGRSSANVVTSVMPPVAGPAGRGALSIGIQNSGASDSRPSAFKLMPGLASDGNPKPSGITPITRYGCPASSIERPTSSAADANRRVHTS